MWHFKGQTVLGISIWKVHIYNIIALQLAKVCLLTSYADLYPL